MAGRPRYPPRCIRGDPRDGVLGSTTPTRSPRSSTYGAVDIDPGDLTVRVILNGNPDDIPAWYFPHRDTPEPERYAAELLTTIDTMRRVVVDCFTARQWPDVEQIDVGFESFERAGANGGWRYFTG